MDRPIVLPGKASGFRGAGSETEPEAFDFRRPERVSREQVEQIRFVHDNFVRAFSASLAIALGCPVASEPVAVRQSPYSEFLAELEPFSCMLCLSIRPLHANAVIAIDCSLAFAALESLLGSRRSNVVPVARDFTDIERNVLDLVFQMIVSDYGKAWGAIAALEFHIEKMRQHPQTLDAMAEGEPVAGTVANLQIGKTPGKIGLALPSLALQTVWRGLEEQRVRRAAAEGAAGHRERLIGLLAAVELKLDVRLEGASMLFRNFAAMKQGDVINLGQPVDRNLDCLVNGKLKYKGQVVSNGSRSTFRIDRLTDRVP